MGFGGGGGFFPTPKVGDLHGPSWTPTFTTRAQLVDGLIQLLSQRFVCDVFTENSQQAHQGHSFHHLATNKTNKTWSFGKNSWTTGGEKSYLERERVMMTTLCFFKITRGEKHGETMHFPNCLEGSSSMLHEYMNIWYKTDSSATLSSHFSS